MYGEQHVCRLWFAFYPQMDARIMFSMQRRAFYTSYNLHLKQKHHFPTETPLCPAGDCNDEFLSQSPSVLLRSHFTVLTNQRPVFRSRDLVWPIRGQSPSVLLRSHFTVLVPLCSTFHKQTKINKQWREINLEECSQSKVQVKIKILFDLGQVAFI